MNESAIFENSKENLDIEDAMVYRGFYYNN
jgi:5'-deoxynucleotidase YfbR-like HD superfamily hydrolase